jgi:hypothetical protein
VSAAASPRPVLVAGQGTVIDGEYAGDHWDAGRLGVPARRGRGAAVNAGALAMSRFSAFLAENHPGVAGEAGITRPLLEGYLSWLLARATQPAPGRWR